MRYSTSRRRGVRRPLALACAASLLALVGCSGEDESLAGDSDSGAQNAKTLSDAPARGSGGGAMVADEAADTDTASTTDPGPQIAQDQLVIRTGEVTLTADDLNQALDDVERLVKRYGGYLAQERTVNDDEGRTTRTEVELRVPSEDFRTVLSALEEVGEVARASTQEEDVTTEVIDVESRVRTQEVSLQRLRSFLGEASNVSAMIRLESEIARREADLASLRAQQDYLEDQTSLSTIQLAMESSEKRPRGQDRLEEAGFLTGLSNGWDALLGVLLVGATVLGALTPFAVLLLVLGVPAWLWLRTSRRHRSGAPAPAGPTA